MAVIAGTGIRTATGGIGTDPIDTNWLHTGADSPKII
jgi:hypothetical protein